MPQPTEDSRRLASLAVFRELYDSKKDVYGIISCFLTELIVGEAKFKFSLNEISCLLNETFNFSIPEAIVKTSLHRLVFLKKEQGYYHAQLDGIKSPSLGAKTDEITQINNSIINDLFLFIEKTKKSAPTEIEKQEIMQSFCSFILDKSDNQKYAEYISAFIVSKQQDPLFINQFKCITEGVVLYTGLMFDDNISSVGSWNTKLTIFLETEMLFNFLGYNGELYKLLFNELLTFIKEINRKSSSTLIKLKYFSQVKSDVEHFFKKAEYIIEGKGTANPGKPAMSAILDGCKSQSDVVEKKVNFYRTLSLSNIEEDIDFDYFKDSNHKYNIIDNPIIEKISKEIDININEVTKSLNFLNFVNIRRADAHTNNFENIGYILLTGNSATNQIAWKEPIKQNGQVPLATNIDFLTSKFWFKLNKGFGSGIFPKTFDIITKAQILLSTQLNKSVGNKFEKLQNEFKNGTLTEEQAAAVLVELRKGVRKPEDISDQNLTFVLDSISENSIENIIREQELFKNKAKQQEEENVQLKEKIEEGKNINIKLFAEKLEIIERKNEKELTINKIKDTINNTCKNKHTEIIDCFLSLIWGSLMSILIYQWGYLELILTSYVLLFIAIIITFIFAELRFKKQLLALLPPKFKEYIPEWLNFPKIRMTLENKFIQKCILKKEKDIGLDN